MQVGISPEFFFPGQAIGTGLIVLFGCGSVCASLSGAYNGVWQVAAVRLGAEAKNNIKKRRGASFFFLGGCHVCEGRVGMVESWGLFVVFVFSFSGGGEGYGGEWGSIFQSPYFFGISVFWGSRTQAIV